MTLEERIRDKAKKGELTHLAIIPRANHKTGEITFAASYSPAKKWGHAFGEDADPVVALEKALTGRVKAP